MKTEEQLYVMLEVTSTHPNKLTSTLLKEIRDAIPQLEADLSKHRTVQVSSLRREGTLPLDAATAMVALGAFVGPIVGEMTKEFAKKFADDVHDWLRQRWPWASFSLKSVSPEGGNRPQKASGKKKPKKVRKSLKRKK